MFLLEKIYTVSTSCEEALAFFFITFYRYLYSKQFWKIEILFSSKTEGRLDLIPNQDNKHVSLKSKRMSNFASSSLLNWEFPKLKVPQLGHTPNTHCVHICLCQFSLLLCDLEGKGKQCCLVCHQ